MQIQKQQRTSGARGRRRRRGEENNELIQTHNMNNKNGQIPALPTWLLMTCHVRHARDSHPFRLHIATCAGEVDKLRHAGVWLSRIFSAPRVPTTYLPTHQGQQVGRKVV
jgi:hypothetical protein